MRTLESTAETGPARELARLSAESAEVAGEWSREAGEIAERARSVAKLAARVEEVGDGPLLAKLHEMASRLAGVAETCVDNVNEILSVSLRAERVLVDIKSALAAIQKAEQECGAGCFMSLGIPARTARARVAAARDVVAVIEANAAAAVDAKAITGETLTATKEIKSGVAEAAKKMGEEKSGCNCQKKKKNKEEEEVDMVKAIALEAIKKKMAEFGWM